jgi:nucleotide-binding universal stress UspA family protein
VLVVRDQDFATSGPALVAYDGSDDAQAAIATAAQLFPGRSTVVVHAWRSALHDPQSGRSLLVDLSEELLAVAQGYAEMTKAEAQADADEGANLAREHGLDARAEIIAMTGSAWGALSEAAQSVDAAVIVAGSRGRGGIASALLGSVSSGLVSNAERPTLVVRRPEAVP